MAFTRNPSDTDVSPATYTADGASDLILSDQQRDIAVDGSDKDDVIRINADALAASALYNYDVRGFEGKDEINVFAALIQNSTFNGNIGDDTLTVTGASLNGSFVLGGKDNDTINVFQVSDGEVNGNLGNDIITVDSFDVAESFNASIRGGQGQDSIFIDGGTYKNSSIFGDKGRDNIRLTGNGTYTGSSVFGGEDNDTIVVVAGVAAEGLVLDGGLGNDSIFALGSESVTVFGGEGNDIIATGATTSNSTTATSDVDAGKGADTVTFGVVETEIDTYVFNTGDSVAATATTLPAPATASVAVGQTITFGNGVDLINGFQANTTTGASTDKVDIDFTAAGVVDLLDFDGAGTAAIQSDVLAANTVYEVYGSTTTSAAGVITFQIEAENAADTGQESLYIVGGGNETVANVFTNNTSMFISDNDLVAASFV